MNGLRMLVPSRCSLITNTFCVMMKQALSFSLLPRVLAGGTVSLPSRTRSRGLIGALAYSQLEACSDLRSALMT